jgi:hypothetical protein
VGQGLEQISLENKKDRVSKRCEASSCTFRPAQEMSSAMRTASSSTSVQSKIDSPAPSAIEGVQNHDPSNP